MTPFVPRACGAIPDDPRENHQDMQFGEVDATQANAGGGPLFDDRPPRIFQGPNETCMSTTAVKTVVMTEKRALNPFLVQPSVAFMHWIGRKAAQAPGTTAQRGMPPLTGVSPRDLQRALQVSGYVPEALWPYENGRTLNQPPSPLVTDVAALGQAGCRMYSIFDKGASRRTELQRARDLGYPAWLCMTVDQPFMQWVGDAPVTKIDPAAPWRHAVVPWRFDDQKRVLTCCNHWEGHGYDGDLFDMAYDLLENDDVIGDVRVLSFVPQAFSQDWANQHFVRT